MVKKKPQAPPLVDAIDYWERKEAKESQSSWKIVSKVRRRQN